MSGDAKAAAARELPIVGEAQSIKHAADVLPLWFEGYTQTQIARRLEITLGSVSSTIARARRAGVPLENRRAIRALKPINSDDKIAILKYTKPAALALKWHAGPMCRIRRGNSYLHKTAEGLTPHSAYAWQGRREAADKLIKLLPIEGLAVEQITERARA